MAVHFIPTSPAIRDVFAGITDIRCLLCRSLNLKRLAVLLYQLKAADRKSEIRFRFRREYDKF